MVTWAPASLTVGTALGPSQLNATANVAGRFVYTPSAGFIMNTAGAQKLTAVFTPTDTTTYSSINVTKSVWVAKATPIVTWGSPSAVPLGTTLGPSKLNATANVDGAFVYSPPAGTVMNTAGANTLTATFTPADTADYKPVTTSRGLWVNKGVPVISWPAPPLVAFGTALGHDQLNATAIVPGSFTYSPPAGTVMNTAGSVKLTVTFTPTDTADYQTVTAGRSLWVNRGVPVISWTTPAPVYVGAVLGPAQLNATASVPGSFTYTPASGAKLKAAGTTTLAVNFAPTDTKNYNSTRATVPIVVNPATPVISWSPGAVALGSALGPSQLNASANAPGTFDYSPPAGTVITSGGAVTLSASFTPTDMADYTNASATAKAKTYTSGVPNIQHIVVIMMENRSFDNIFSGFPGADAAQSGVSNGQTVPLQPVSLAQGTDLDHQHSAWLQDWDNGNMDGFTLPGIAYPARDFPYAYVPRNETAPLWALASAYTLGDRMFASNSGPSFPAHMYMIAGQAGVISQGQQGSVSGNPSSSTMTTARPAGCDATVDTSVTVIGPNGTDLPNVFPCLEFPTVADLLDANGVTWRYYAPQLTNLWSPFEAINHIRFGPDWNKNVSNQQVFTDLQNGNLAQMTWVIPGYFYSDHAGSGATANGPDWVASIVNAIGQSQYWNSTAILISWDDWGGWYDHVPPPQVDYMGLGFR
ncbi:MAG TPA: alkaline phosphatase family protein, partial [Candidatus Sulfopaludibacter sp.]|nr:alkaline phosphatase family protein [Candidatus Sulfopaludibacter sp.]